jgi:hypothetical protein
VRRLLVIAALGLMGPAHACMFAADTRPAEWYAWSSALFSGDVTSVEQDAQKSLDIVTVRVAEAFKGPQGSMATLRVPQRFWTSCKLRRPALGDHVLVALNPHGDTLVVPLTASYTERLRALKSEQAR